MVQPAQSTARGRAGPPTREPLRRVDAFYRYFAVTLNCRSAVMASSRRPVENDTGMAQSWVPEGYPPEGWAEHYGVDEYPQGRDYRSHDGGAYDALQEGSYRGRGPKNYRRSDARLREIICERLTDDPFIDASQVSVEVTDCDVTLRGTVAVRQQKYAIEDLVAEVSGVDEIHNQLSVGDTEIEERMSGL
jgi:hypothetical protein